MPLPPAAYRIRMRWVKVAFHMPSSNSCRTSETNIEKKSIPNLNSFVEKAFYHASIQTNNNLKDLEYLPE
jgi:hypothetical protein